MRRADKVRGETPVEKKINRAMDKTLPADEKKRSKELKKAIMH